MKTFFMNGKYLNPVCTGGGGQICPPLRKLLISLKFCFSNPYWDLLTFCAWILWFFYRKLKYPMCLRSILDFFFWWAVWFPNRKFSITFFCQKNMIILKILTATVFKVLGFCFQILTNNIQGINPAKKGIKTSFDCHN